MLLMVFRKIDANITCTWVTSAEEALNFLLKKGVPDV